MRLISEFFSKEVGHVGSTTPVIEFEVMQESFDGVDLNVEDKSRCTHVLAFNMRSSSITCTN